MQDGMEFEMDTGDGDEYGYQDYNTAERCTEASIFVTLFETYFAGILDDAQSRYLHYRSDTMFLYW